MSENLAKVKRMWKSEAFRKHVHFKCKERRLKLIDMKIQELQNLKHKIENSDGQIYPTYLGKSEKVLQNSLDIDDDFALIIIQSYEGIMNVQHIDVQKSQKWGMKLIDVLFGS